LLSQAALALAVAMTPGKGQRAPERFRRTAAICLRRRSCPFAVPFGHHFACAFNSAAPDEEAKLPKTGIVHAVLVMGVIGDCLFDPGTSLGVREEAATRLDYVLDVTFPKFCADQREPFQGGRGVGAKGRLDGGAVTSVRQVKLGASYRMKVPVE
jgi:hypothetical protein